MMRLRRLLLPWTWIKIAASSIALIVNGVQLSEVADKSGDPLSDPESQIIYREMARAVTREGRWLRKHIGALDD